MTTTAVYETKETYFVPHYQIKISGRELPHDVIPDVTQVTYKDSVTEIDSFDLTINNYDSLLGLPKYEPFSRPEHKELFDPGQTVEVWLGYFNNLRLMLTGEITTIEPSFATGGFTLSVRGLNVLHTFRTEQHTYAWENKTDSEIAKELGQKPVTKGKPGLGIKVRAENSSNENAEEYVLMNNAYDIVFLLERARRRGYDLVLYEADEKTGQERHLYFGPSEVKSNVPTYLLEWGRSLVSFRPTLSTARQVSEVVVKGWDRRKNKPIEEKASWLDVYKSGTPEYARMQQIAQAFGNRREIITDKPVHTKKQAKKLAEDTLRNIAKGLVEASGETIGLPDLRAGRTIHIDRLGDRFNGVYYVTETTHIIGSGGYKTQFKARREEGMI